MHTRPARADEIGQLAYLATAAHGENPFFTKYIRAHPTTYPEHWVHFYSRRFRLLLNTPEAMVRLCVTDDSDAWWDEQAGEEIVGMAVYRRQWGVEEKADEKALAKRRKEEGWTNDDVFKGMLFVELSACFGSPYLGITSLCLIRCCLVGHS